MSRHGYTDDTDDPLALGRWRAQVGSAVRGKRGQRFLRDLADALDAMPVKELAADSFTDEAGAHCTLGVLAEARGVDMTDFDPEDVGSECAHIAAGRLDIAHQLAAEVMYENDEEFYHRVRVPVHGPVQHAWMRHPMTQRIPCDDAPAKRWERMRAWVQNRIKAPAIAAAAGGE